MTAINLGQEAQPGTLSSHEVLRIAQRDAETAYPDLSNCRITLLLQTDGWHVDYDLAEPCVAGGGPHYVIDPISGDILSKIYYQ